MSRPLSARALMLCASLALAACAAPTESDVGSVFIDFPLTVADITSATYEIGGPGISPAITGALTLSSGRAQGTVADVPVGTGRIVTVRALVGTQALCTGSTTVDVVRNQTATANILVVCVDEVGTIAIRAAFDPARTPDSATATVSGAGIAAPIVVPLNLGPGVALGKITGVPVGTARRVEIATSFGGTTECTGSADVDVASGATTTIDNLTLTCSGAMNGSIVIDGQLNFLPAIHGIYPNFPGTPAGGSVSLQVVASDADNDPLTYSWSDNTGRSAAFSADAAATTTWSSTGLTPGNYTLTVTVTDGITPAVTGSIVLAVGNGAPVGWANTQAPATGSVAAGSPFNVYGQIYQSGLTEAPDAAAGVIAEAGFGPQGDNPSTNPERFTWQRATFNVQSGNNDEYMAILKPAVAGTYGYCYRFSTTGGRTWTYADLDGSGNGFSTAAMGVLTAN